MTFSSVVSLHTNEFGCGVAKFSKALAERLDVPFAGIDGDWGAYPLFSLKLSELSEADRDALQTKLLLGPDRYGVFWHDGGDETFSELADVVFYADPSLGPHGLWCPSLLPEPNRRRVRLFSFGMAHKLQTPLYRRVRALLDAAELPYHLRVSVGLHEGTSLSDALHHFDALRDIMGPEQVTILGILSDEAVNLELQDCDHVLAFFEKGLRANNTTVHAALQAGKSVITNHDAQTPGYLKAATKDIVTRQAWESSMPYHYSWDNLLRQMEQIYAATASRQSAHQR